MTERVRILEWWRITSDGKETARAVCPSCGVSGSLEDHEIADDGTVSPSLVCATEGCGFHAFVTLAGWQRQSIRSVISGD